MLALNSIIFLPKSPPAPSPPCNNQLASQAGINFTVYKYKEHLPVCVLACKQS